MFSTAMTGCVALDQFWSRVRPSEPIPADPIGGYVLLYWIDADGNVCHGEPGVTGQPGPAAIEAINAGAFDDARHNRVVPPQQFTSYQHVGYRVQPYLDTTAVGQHLLQFDNVVWRDRSNGVAFIDRADHHYSVPQLVDVANLPPIVTPAYAYAHAGCADAAFIALETQPSDTPVQHPTQCRVKTFPTDAAMTEPLLLSKCVAVTPQGARYTFY